MILALLLRLDGTFRLNNVGDAIPLWTGLSFEGNKPTLPNRFQTLLTDYVAGQLKHGRLQWEEQKLNRFPGTADTSEEWPAWISPCREMICDELRQGLLPDEKTGLPFSKQLQDLLASQVFLTLRENTALNLNIPLEGETKKNELQSFVRNRLWNTARLVIAADGTVKVLPDERDKLIECLKDEQDRLIDRLKTEILPKNGADRENIDDVSADSSALTQRSRRSSTCLRLPTCQRFAT